MSSLKDFEDNYHKLTQPTEFVSHFKDDAEFIEWVELGTPADIKAAIEVFLLDELFEHCEIMKVIYDRKLLEINE